ncbi:transcriptional activator, TenA family [Kribbella flavida DSM 17836]|uniref:Aminopyrimidine aminohydrolase n=1 Tax=Kribbella flavida (strain DSM 17836 / JCM 10339 / NBRC 14399) TaxID=479435 RepID=D2PS54_KRIFD|nr:thiaminase II [Kribbella flavida]ADB31178.1 transcriptional activator, TenA family [Kribbella flavida DSM 17836]
MTFSAELWDAGAAKVYAEIVRHPFITGLTDGTLPHDKFRYFIVQDSHYLRAYSRALALAAGRATDEDAVSMFARHAAEAIDVERELHASLLGSLGLTSADVDRSGSGPTTTAYMSYLTAVCATGTYAEAVAAVLPCYWIYRDVGRELLKQSSPDPLYAEWIATYGSPEFDAVVESVLAVTDRLGAEVGPAERDRCHRHFATTTRYEWMFWDAAYQELEWPV